MASVLVVFESKYGQTSKIAERIGQEHRRRGHAARVLHVDVASRLDLGSFDALVVVAPVYFAHHPRSIARFERYAAEALANRPSMFVSVSNSAGNADPAARANALRIAKAFVSELPWAPAVTITVAGAIAYPRYNWLLRLVMKQIALSTGAPTDTSHSHELTDWAALDTDLQRMFALLDEHLPRHDGSDGLAPSAAAE